MPWLCDRPMCKFRYRGKRQVLVCPLCGCRRLHYQPTAKEIAEACGKIQKTWTEKTERARRGVVVEIYNFPLIDDTWRRSWESEVI